MKHLPKLLLLTACGIILVKFRPLLFEAGQKLASADQQLIIFALVLIVIYRVTNASGWGLLANSLGGRIKLFSGIKIWLQSESMRWLPGNVWGYVSRAYMGEQAGLSREQGSLALSLELVLTLLAWGITAFFFSLASGNLGFWLSGLETHLGSLTMMIAVAPIFVVLGALAFSKLKKKLGKIDFPSINLLECSRVLGLYLGLCSLNGACLYFVCHSLGLRDVSLSLAIAANANAFIFGLLAPFAPGGLGIREGSLAALLAPVSGLEAGLAAALLWRVLQIVAELLCLGAFSINFSTDSFQITKVSHEKA